MFTSKNTVKEPEIKNISEDSIPNPHRLQNIYLLTDNVKDKIVEALSNPPKPQSPPASSEIVSL